MTFWTFFLLPAPLRQSANVALRLFSIILAPMHQSDNSRFWSKTPKWLTHFSFLTILAPLHRSLTFWAIQQNQGGVWYTPTWFCEYPLLVSWMAKFWQHRYISDIISYDIIWSHFSANFGASEFEHPKNSKWSQKWPLTISYQMISDMYRCCHN